MRQVREQETGKSKFNVHVFFHNLKYDRTLIESCPTMRIVKICEKDNAIYSLKVRFEGRVITIRDSLKMIPISISKFPNTFSLPASLKKQDEFIIYRFFSEENAHDEFTCTPRQYVTDHVFDGDDQKNEQLKDNYIRKLTEHLHKLWQQESPIRCGEDCCDNERFHPWLLYKDYLKYDVLVLAAGIVVFQREFSQVTNNRMDPLETLTISSYAYKYMGLLGAYDGAYEMCDTFRAFQGKAVYGGRVFCNPLYEGKCIKDCKLKYMDACSLYPSAIEYVCRVKGGFPTGPCRVLQRGDLNYEFLQTETSEYTVEISIHSISKRQLSIPAIIARNEAKSSIDYLNEMPADGAPLRVVVDKQTLEDYIQFHDIGFVILQGIYWTGKLNPTWGSLVTTLYEERLKQKAQNKTVQAELIKLMLNSMYGRTILKSSTTELAMLQRQKWKDGEWEEVNWQQTLVNMFHVIKSFRYIGEHAIEYRKFVHDNTYTLPKYGSMILAASKHIMTYVFSLASKLGRQIYYTDTDSFVMAADDVDDLAAEYLSETGRPLLGTKLGQMHSDFTFKKNGVQYSAEHVYSTEFFLVAKKNYCHRLVYDPPEGPKLDSIQFKCKGCTQVGLLYKAREYGQGDEGVIELYRDVTNGVEVNIPLNPPGSVRFVYSKENRVSTPDNIFYRVIKSPAAMERLTLASIVEEMEVE
jgi:hypothetical protein